MENKQIFYKIGRIPSTTSIHIDPAFDINSQNRQPDSGIEMNVAEANPHVEEQSTSEEHAKEIAQVLEQQENTQKTRRKRRKGKNNKQSETRFDDANLERHRTDLPEMQKLIKIRQLLKLFHEKTTLNSLFRTPVSYSPFENILSQENAWFFQGIRFEFHKNVANIAYLLKMLFITLYMFFFPLTLLYEALADSHFAAGLKMVGLAFNCLDLLETLGRSYAMDNSNALSKQKYRKFVIEKRVRMLLELLILISTVISLINDHQIAHLLFAGLGLNINHFLEQVQKLEDEFLTATYRHKYWNLFNVILKNVFVCHLLACTLIAITFFNTSDNWMIPSNINSLAWYEQYIWSYYFGTTIILTIGFGDLHANNSAEAFFIIVISFFACVFFGYNINYIGNLINSIKQDENEKEMKLKLLNSLSKKSKVSKHVYEEISKYIVEESKIKQESNYGEEKKLLKELPESLRSSYLQEVNEKLFNHLRQLIPFSNAAIEKLSLNIQARFCHPDQLIKGAQSQPSLIILQSGEVGYLAQAKYPSRLRSAIIQRISNSIHSQSKIICVDLLLDQQPKYDIKSLDYTIIYEMGKDKFEESIVSSKKDYQIYRELLDRCKFKLNEFALIKCRFCQGKLHSLFECPRVHYTPFRKTLPLKHLKGGNFRQSRVNFTRSKKQMQCEIIFQSRTEREIMEESFTIEHSVTPQIKVQMTGEQSNGLRRIKGSSFRPSNENMFMTMQMVTQLRKDINNLKRSSFINFTFNLWDNVDCDEACNYQHYFYKWNPDYLTEKEIKNALSSKARTNRIRRIHRQGSTF